MIANDILLNAFTRVHESLHRTLGDITPEELIKEPHPSIGWLAWRINRVMDSNVSRLSGRKQLWIGEGWAGTFGMPSEPADYGRSARHTREQVNSFRASAQQLLDYHDTTYERMKTYLSSVSAVHRVIHIFMESPRRSCNHRGLNSYTVTDGLCRARMYARYYRYKGHQFSVTTQPVHPGKACTFFSDIHWVERNKEEFTRYTGSRTFITPQEARMEALQSSQIG